MPHPVKMPRLGQDMEEGVVVEWLKSVGDVVAERELLVRIETDKAEVDFEAPMAGFLIAILLQPGAVAAIGDTIAWISEDPGETPPAPESLLTKRAVPQEATTDSQQATLPDQASSPRPRRGSSPLARKRAAALGVNMDTVEGTGPGGRITEDDVRLAHERGSPSKVSGQRELPRMRRAVAGQMSRATSVPQFRLMSEVVLDGIEDFRANSQASYTDLIHWAAAQALNEHEAVNSSWVESDPPRIEIHPKVNVGFAVGVEDGLVVPVIKDAAGLSLTEAANERRRLEAAVHSGELRANDLEGATFTVSNLGGAGVDEFTALVNTPEAGILAVGVVKSRPVVTDGELVIASTVRLTLTGDHRVFDGIEGARFMTTIARLLSAPETTTTKEEQ